MKARPQCVERADLLIAPRSSLQRAYCASLSCRTHAKKLTPFDLIVGWRHGKESVISNSEGKCGKRRDERFSDCRLFRSPKPSSETRHHDWPAEPFELPICPEHDARMRCSPRNAHNRWQPGRSTGVPDAASTQA